MNPNLKRLIAVLLVMLLVFSSIPVTAIAAAYQSEDTVSKVSTKFAALPTNDDFIFNETEMVFSTDNIQPFGAASLEEIYFEGFDFAGFPFTFEILAYNLGVATVSVTPNIAYLDIESITVANVDEYFSGTDRDVPVNDGIFSIHLNYFHEFVAITVVDGRSAIYICDFWVTITEIEPLTLEVKVGSMSMIDNSAASGRSGEVAEVTRINLDPRGRAIAPLSMIAPRISWPARDHQQVPAHQNLTLEWGAVSGANHHIASLRNLTRDPIGPNGLVFDQETIRGTTRVVAWNPNLPSGNNFRFAVTGALANGTRGPWAFRYFSIQPVTQNITPTSISVSPASASIAAGQTRQLTANVQPNDATDRSVSWSSSNTNVATVNANGLVTARAVGSAIITARTNSGNRTATAAITVTATANNRATIRYWGNGWTGGTRPLDQSVTVPGSIILSGPGTMTKNGYVFHSWRCSQNMTHFPGERVHFTTTMTWDLTAHWVTAPTITAPTITAPTHNQQVPANNAVVRWNSVAGATSYLISVRDLHTYNLLPSFNNRNIGNVTSFQIYQNQLVPGRQYRVAIAAVGGGQTLWSAGRYFSVQGGNTGTVTIQYRGNGHTSGAVPANQTVTTPGSINLRPQGNLQRTGYTFGGWQDSGGTVWAAGQSRSWPTATTATITLDAVWNRASSTELVDVHLYFDIKVDRTIYPNDTFYRQELRRIAQTAAHSFYYTFDIRMVIPNASNITPLRSAKNDCEEDTMRRAPFICYSVGPCVPWIEAPNSNPPRDAWATQHGLCGIHHSCGYHMIAFVLGHHVREHTSGRGLHTMFFAGRVCGGGSWLNSAYGMAGTLGVYTAFVADNMSIVTSSAVMGGRPTPGHPDLPRVVDPSVFLTSMRTLQHEWSHNYGTHDSDRCLTACIMAANWFDIAQDVGNVWCRSCENIIRNNRTAHSR